MHFNLVLKEQLDCVFIEAEFLLNIKVSYKLNWQLNNLVTCQSVNEELGIGYIDIAVPNEAIPYMRVHVFLYEIKSKQEIQSNLEQS